MGNLPKIDIAASHLTLVGCSMIAQAIGISRWGTPYDLWLHYTGRQLLSDISHDLRVALGEPMEQVLAPFIEQRLGGKLRRDRKEYKHPTLPLVAHLDFRLNATAEAVIRSLGRAAHTRPIVDTKTSLGYSARHRFGADGTDEVDVDVLLQVHGYMLLTGAEIAYVAALVPGPELKIFSVLADNEMQDLIEDGIRDFWKCVETDTPPEARTEEDARRIWARHQEGKIIEADSTLVEDLRDLARVKAAIRNFEKEEQALKNRILPRLSDAEAVWERGTSLATYKANKDSVKVDYQGLAAELMAGMDPGDQARIMATYTRTVPGARVLRLAKSLEAV